MIRIAASPQGQNLIQRSAARMVDSLREERERIYREIFNAPTAWCGTQWMERRLTTLAELSVKIRRNEPRMSA